MLLCVINIKKIDEEKKNCNLLQSLVIEFPECYLTFLVIESFIGDDRRGISFSQSCKEFSYSQAGEGCLQTVGDK